MNCDTDNFLKMLTSFRKRFIDVHNTDELLSNVKTLLCLKDDEVKVINVTGSVRKFTALIDCKNVEIDVLKKDLQEKSNITVRLTCDKKTTKVYDRQVYFRCQHKTQYQPTMSVGEVLNQHPDKRFQNLNCPFMLAVKYKCDKEADYPVHIHVDWEHKHSLTSLAYLSFKDIPADVSKTISDLFENGYTPALAYREFIRKKKEENPQEMDWLLVMSDRSKVPRRCDFNKLFMDYNNVKYGSLNLDNLYKCLKERISIKELESPETIINYQKFDSDANDPFILVLVTPLMLRVHEKVKAAAELVFFDSTGGMDEYNLRLFLMVTHSPLGALPLGIIITSDECTETLVSALEMFKSALPEKKAFFGKGRKGPSVIMTDNCSEVYDALSAVWKQSMLLLCVF